MKKVITLFALFFLSFVILQAQRNTFSFGDKSFQEKEKIINLFDKEINDYQQRIDQLSKENQGLWSKFSLEKEVSDAARKSFANNEKLIAAYRENILEMQREKQSFILRASLQERNRRVYSRGNNPAKLEAAANAYAVMSYADAFNSSFGDKQVNSSQLKGLAVNNHYQDAEVIVYGPGGFKRTSPVPRNGGSFIFNVPYPGTYTFVYIFRNGTEKVSVECRPGSSIFFDKDGNQYDLKATLMSRW